MKIDPIIAVKDVELSSDWYQSVFGCKSKHGGKEFDVLVSNSDEVLLCLHKWGEHEHPTLMKPSNSSNGMILYFRTENMSTILENVKKLGHPIEKELALNENSNRQEFSILDLDGYYITVSDFHVYEG